MEENFMQSQSDGEEEYQSIVITEDDGTERELFLVDQTKVGGETYLLLTDTKEDGGDGYIFRLAPIEGNDEEWMLEPVSDNDYDYLAGIFSEQSDVDFEA